MVLSTAAVPQRYVFLTLHVLSRYVQGTAVAYRLKRNSRRYFLSTGKLRKTLVYVALAVIFAFGAILHSSLYAGEAQKEAKKTHRVYHSKIRDIKRAKGKTIISRALADRIKEDNSLVLSTAAIKAVTLKNNDSGFQVVQVDKGGLADKMGFKDGDVIWKVNGLDMKAAKDQSETLEKSDRFKVLLLRRGKQKTLHFQIE